jgi:hypothetical protein
MNCPQCGEAVEPGAAFCGNCGQALHTDAQTAETNAATPDPASPSNQTVPSYAVADAKQSRSEVKAMVGLIVAVLAVPGAIIPALGATLAVVALVLATTLRAGAKKLLRNVAIGFSSLAIVLSVAVYAFNLNDLQQTADSTETANSNRVAGVSDTPCYKVSLPQLPTVENANGSCNLQAGSADTLAASSEIFTIDTAKQDNATEAEVMAVAKEIVESTFKSSLPEYTITSQRQGNFADSPAYITDAKDAKGSTVQMAMIFRPVQHGENIFVLVHGLDNGQASVSVAEEGWEWK